MIYGCAITGRKPGKVGFTEAHAKWAMLRLRSAATYADAHTTPGRPYVLFGEPNGRNK
jgi:hypothetical protein